MRNLRFVDVDGKINDVLDLTLIEDDYKNVVLSVKIKNGAGKKVKTHTNIMNNRWTKQLI